MTLNAPRPLEPEAFPALLDAATRHRRGAAGAAALDAGLDLQGLCRFAAGSLAPAERRQVETQLASTPWATSKVAALIRGSRGNTNGGLARGLMEAARAGSIDPAGVAGRALLREAGVEDGGTENDPVARAGRALSRGRHDEASQALAQIVEASPLVKVAQRVAQLERDPDLALCELLELV